MKRICIMLIAMLLAALTTVSGQRLTHDFRDVTVAEALQYVQQQTSRYRLLYISNGLSERRITVSLHDVDVPEAVACIIAGLPIRMDYDDTDIYLESLPTPRPDAWTVGQASQKEAPVKTIVLEPIEVDSIMPMVILMPDGFNVNVAGLSLSETMSLNEVLCHLPGWVLQQHDASANHSPTYYIDGRPVYRLEELDELAASDIKSIKVTYGKHNEATTVRITTRRLLNNGWNLQTRMAYRQATKPDGHSSLQVAYHHGQWDADATISHRTAASHVHLNAEQDYRMDSIIHQGYMARATSRNTSISATARLSYRLDSLSTMGLRAMVRHTLPTEGQYDYEGHADHRFQSYDGLWGNSLIRTQHGQSVDVNAHYHGHAGPLWLEADVDWLHDRQRQNKHHQDRWQNLAATSNSIDNDLLAARLTVRWAAWTCEVGHSLTHRLDDFRYEPLYTEGRTDSSQIDFLHHRLSVLTAYDLPLTSYLRLTAGLRYEYSYGGSHILPHLMLNADKDSFLATIAYQHRVSYPAYAQLTNNREYVNAYDTKTGNPYLLPVLCHELTARTAWHHITLGGDYRHTQNEIVRWANKRDEAENCAVVYHPCNIDRLSSLTLYAEFMQQSGSAHTQLTLGLHKQWLDMELADQTLSLNRPQLFALASGLVRLGSHWKADASLLFDGEGDHGNMRYDRHRITAVLGVTYTSRDGRMALRLAGHDLVGMYHHETLFSPQVTVRTRTSFDTRCCELILRYNLNNNKHNKYQGKGAGYDERIRLYPQVSLTH